MALTTLDFVLSKFSSRQRNADGSQADWVHRSSPMLLVSLAVQSSVDDRSAQHARLVVFSRRDSHQDNIIEELDLLSFTAFDVAALRVAPLRAVYNMNVVGIKYMHPLSSTKAPQPMFNHIQMRFRNATDATEFIKELSKFCPCKEEISATQPSAARASMGPPTRPAILTAKQGIVSTLHQSDQRIALQDSQNWSSSPPRTTGSSFLHSQSVSMQTAASTPSSTHTISPATRSGPASHSNRPASNALPFPDNHSHVPVPFQTAPFFQSADISSPAISNSSQPNLIHISPASTLTSSHSSSAPKKLVFDAVRSLPDLYQLSTPDLEQAIGQIIREPGFLEYVHHILLFTVIG
ncbi:hypothetical protein BKA62DRAFT_764278 [Auriculariales sp. MPI-PUGE-AT-0066]|nr:hypothetical protein BKA62DRAFT_764278 [Auriculariales sp. MPI-PUGE-AT-0066]